MANHFKVSKNSKLSLIIYNMLKLFGISLVKIGKDDARYIHGWSYMIVLILLSVIGYINPENKIFSS